LRPWPADDGLLVRLRLIGGRISSESLLALAGVAEEYADGRVHLTGRANLQIRGLPGSEGRLAPEVLSAIEATGLLPTRGHELVRNIMVSPRSGLAEGRTDLRPVAAELDRLLCSDGQLAELPGRFLFVLDDGRGDLVGRSCDLGLVVLDAGTAQLKVGDAWGPVVALESAAFGIVRLAREFLDRRGSSASAPWHVVELLEPLVQPQEPDVRLPAPVGPLPYGAVAGGRHVAVPDEGLNRRSAEALAAGAPELVVTPWRGVLVPEESR